MAREKNNKLLKLFGISVIAVLLLSYVYIQTKELITHPAITITSPQNGSTVDTKILEINGTVKNSAEIQMNGRNIFVDEDGKFTESTLLADGYNRIDFSVEDRFGRMGSEKLEIVFVSP